MNARVCFASVLPLVSTLLLGCNFDLHLGDSTRGVLHQADFAYVSGSCLFGCTVDQPMMVGGLGKFSVAGDGLPDELRVSADPAGIISTSVERSRSCCVGSDTSAGCSLIGDSDPCQGTIETTFTLTVKALKAGKTPLQVFDVGGAMIDFVMIEAKDPTELSVSCALVSDGATDGPLDTIHLGVKDICDLSVDALDETGKTLRSDSGFTLAIQDPKVGVLRPSLDLFDALEDPTKSDVLQDSTGKLLARSAGTTSVNVKAGNLTRAVPVEVK